MCAIQSNGIYSDKNMILSTNIYNPWNTWFYVIENEIWTISWVDKTVNEIQGTFSSWFEIFLDYLYKMISGIILRIPQSTNKIRSFWPCRPLYPLQDTDCVGIILQLIIFKWW